MRLRSAVVSLLPPPSHLLLVVGLLDDGQLGVRVGDGEVGVGRVPGAVEHERPLLEEALVDALAVEADLEGPLAPGVLCPGVRGHEGPLGEAVVRVVVVGARREDHGARAHGRAEEELDVAPARGVERDDGLHVLQVVDLRLAARARRRLDRQEERLVGGDLAGRLVGAALAVVARRHRLPLLGQRHHGARVQHAEPEQVVELEPHAAHRPVEAALRVEQRVALRRQHRQVLHVPPGELRAETNAGYIDGLQGRKRDPLP